MNLKNMNKKITLGCILVLSSMSFLAYAKDTDTNKKAPITEEIKTTTTTTTDVRQDGSAVSETNTKDSDKKLLGSNPSTWTPEYLKVKSFKKCLGTQSYRGWKGYCMPEDQPENCPDDSWDKLSDMNILSCNVEEE